MNAKLVLFNKQKFKPRSIKREWLKTKYSHATTVEMLTLRAPMILPYLFPLVLALLTANRALLLMTQVLAIRTSSSATRKVGQAMKLAM